LFYLLYHNFIDSLTSGLVETSLAFFDHYIKGDSSPLLDGPSPDYPEVTIEMRDP